MIKKLDDIDYYIAYGFLMRCVSLTSLEEML